MAACANYFPMLKSVKIVILTRILIAKAVMKNPRLLG